VLRPINGADVPALHRFWTDPDVRRYLWDNEIISIAKVEELVSSSEAFFETANSGFFAIELVDSSGVLVGFCGHRQFEDEQSVELLYGILPEYWGEGLVSEAAREVLRHGFQECGFDRVVAATDTPNQKSVNVMQRLGMVFESRREWHGLDTVFYAMDKVDFAMSS
jgi:ribosomal-protein-alanine N-acetyltransferase